MKQSQLFGTMKMIPLTFGEVYRRKDIVRYFEARTLCATKITDAKQE